MKVTIDGKTIQVEGPKTVLDAAREQGIFIPSLCDHPDLEPFGGCRLCLVEIEGRRGYPPACSTYVEDGMSIQTDSPKIKELRQGALELILSEHPNACLVCREKENCDEYKSTIRKVAEVTGCVLCPNNGRCELQDVTGEMEVEQVHFPSIYRNVDIHREDPFFDRNYNLCILCGRCVRICREVRGASVLTFIERGAETVVGTVLDQPLTDSGCQFCGACVDVCPTGAHTDRAIRYEDVPDKKDQAICPLCSMGCRMDIKTKEGRFIQALPDESGPANRGQACVRGRFLLPAMSRSEARIKSPMIRKKGGWEAVQWDEALKLAAEQLGPFKNGQTVLMSSPQLACEDLFVLNRLAEEVLDTEPVSSGADVSPLAALRQLEENPGTAPLASNKLEDISSKDTFLLIGTDLTVSHPIVWLRIWKSLRNGGQMVVISPDELPFASQSLWLKCNPGTEPLVLTAIAAAVENEKKGLPDADGKEEFGALLNKVRKLNWEKTTGVSENRIKQAAELLSRSEKSLYFAGPENTARPDSRNLLSGMWNLAIQNQAEVFPLELESNQKGWDALHPGITSDKFTRAIEQLEQGNGKALVAAGPMSLAETIQPEFILALAAYPNEITEKADIILPLAAFGEYESLFVNVEGRIQKTPAVLKPGHAARPAWQAAAGLAQNLGHEDFTYSREAEIRKFMQTRLELWSGYNEKMAVAGDLFLPSPQAAIKQAFLSLDADALKPDLSGPQLYIRWTTDHYLGLMFSDQIRGFRLLRDRHWIDLNPETAEKHNIKAADEIVLHLQKKQLEGMARLKQHIPVDMVRITRPGFDSFAEKQMNLSKVTVKRKK